VYKKYVVLFFFSIFVPIFLSAMESEKTEQYKLGLRKDRSVNITSDPATIKNIQSFCNSVKSYWSKAHVVACKNLLCNDRNYNRREVLIWCGVLCDITGHNLHLLKKGYVGFCSFEVTLWVKRENVGVFVIGLKDKSELSRPGIKQTIERVVLKHECCLCNIL